MRRALVALVAVLLLVAAPAGAAPVGTPLGATGVFAHVPAPGYPAYVLVHTNGRVYAGTYTHPESTTPSRVLEWSRDGALLRSWTVPGQVLTEDHGVQVANQTADGKLVLLETSTHSVLTLDTRTGAFRTVARFPAGAVPNYATWGPHGDLFVSDYAEGVIWRIPHGSRTPQRWFSSPAITGVGEFGTAGLRYRPDTHDLLISQQSSGDGAAPPTDGHLYRLPVVSGRPGTLSTLWTSRPGDLPDGFGLGRSGHVYVALAGLANQVVELSATGAEVRRFGDAVTGSNGSSVPFDTPCSATFLGTRILVANQSAVAGDASHQAILSVDVGERGVAPYLPAAARF